MIEGEDRAPVLHRAEGRIASWPGDVVELGQRIRQLEVAVVLGEQRLRRRECEARLRDYSGAGDDADFGRAGPRSEALELADGEEEEVGRHPRRRRETGALQARCCGRRCLDRHVADRHLSGRQRRLEREGRLVGGLVPRRHEATRVGVLELGVERALRAGRRFVVEREKARRLLADRAAIGDLEPVVAGVDRLGEDEAGGLRPGIEVDPAQRDRHAARQRLQADRAEVEIDRIERDAVDRLADLDLDRDRGSEAPCGGVGDHADVVVQRPYAAWQLGRRRRRRGRGPDAGGVGMGNRAQLRTYQRKGECEVARTMASHGSGSVAATGPRGIGRGRPGSSGCTTLTRPIVSVCLP